MLSMGSRFFHCWWVWSCSEDCFQSFSLSSCLKVGDQLQQNNFVDQVQIGFAFQHSAIMCLRGTQLRRSHPGLNPYNVDLAMTRGAIPT